MPHVGQDRIRLARLDRWRTQIGDREFAAWAELDRVDGRTGLRLGNTGHPRRFVTEAAPQGDLSRTRYRVPR